MLPVRHHGFQAQFLLRDMREHGLSANKEQLVHCGVRRLKHENDLKLGVEIMSISHSLHENWDCIEIEASTTGF